MCGGLGGGGWRIHLLSIVLLVLLQRLTYTSHSPTAAATIATATATIAAPFTGVTRFTYTGHSPAAAATIATPFAGVTAAIPPLPPLPITASHAANAVCCQRPATRAAAALASPRGRRAQPPHRRRESIMRAINAVRVL